MVRGLAGQTITTLAADDVANYQKALVQPLNDDWKKTIPNGPAIFAAYRAEAARVRAEQPKQP